eukprot:COSAG01_NODE_70200_length_259_cov_0.650000_1_plen_34_part_10
MMVVGPSAPVCLAILASAAAAPASFASASFGRSA